MQNIKYNDKDYTFFNTGEHCIVKRITFPIKQYDGYYIKNILNDEAIYVNSKPVIVESKYANSNYNTPGNVFIPMEENEKYYEKGAQQLNLNSYLYYLSEQDDERLHNNYELINTSFFQNTVPVVVPSENMVSMKYIDPSQNGYYGYPCEVGMSLEENANLKLKKHNN